MWMLNDLLHGVVDTGDTAHIVRFLIQSQTNHKYYKFYIVSGELNHMRIRNGRRRIVIPSRNK